MAVERLWVRDGGVTRGSRLKDFGMHRSSREGQRIDGCRVRGSKMQGKEQ